MADSDFDGGRHPGCRLPGRCCRPVLLAGLRSRLLPAGADGAAAQAEGPPAFDAKTEAAEKETNAKPHGPLIIAISIDQQKVRVYDANGLFAESPVSTGMKGHSTPMGVFSVIQKHKLHHSNIYSGAPMPYMQRITWSGVAMHAGVLPGYPASHGCIRMPMAFAVKMWNWTRMGARVIVTPGEITPASFSHPLLVAQKVVPQPLIANDPATDAPAVKSDKGADAGHATKPANSEHCEFGARAWISDRPSVTRRRCANRPTPRMPAARMPAINAAVTMSDATPSAAKVQPASDTSNAEAKRGRARNPNRPKPNAADTSDRSPRTRRVSASESVKAEDKPGEAKVEASRKRNPTR